MSVPGPSRPQPLLGWYGAASLLALIFAAGLGAVVLAPQTGPVAAWYPAAGVSVALLALSPRSRWLALAVSVTVVTAAASILGGRDPEVTLVYATGNACEALFAAWVLRHGADEVPRLRGTEDMVRILVAGLAGAASITVFATVGAATLTSTDPWAIARTFFTSHLAATLIVVPAALSLAATRERPRRIAETTVQALALVTATAVVFWPGHGLSLEFAPLPFLVWAALRLDLRVVTLELVAVSAAVTLFSLHGGGPFGYDFERGAVGADSAASLVQLYLLTSAFLTVPLAITVEQRRSLIGELLDSEQMTEATLDTTAALILVTDLAGTVVRVNQAVTALTGYAEDELLGRHIEDMPFAPPGSSGYPAGLPEEPDGQVGRETGAVTRGGDRIKILWNTSYVRDERGRPTYVVITGTDLTAERAAAGLNQHLLQAAITTALIGIDPQGRITLFNAGAERLLGYDQQDMVGVPFVQVIESAQLVERTGSADPVDAFAALVGTIGAEGTTSQRDWTWTGEDGRRLTVSMTLGIAGDALSSRVGYLCVGRDVTEARASQELLVAALEKERVAVERLRKVDSAKNEFVSTVSHELRTPVASIVGYTEMLQDGTVGEPTSMQGRLLASIERSGKRLIALCDDLLTLGGLDSGSAEIDRDVVDLSELVDAAADAMRPLLAGRDLDVDFGATGPVEVLGDRAQLDRVLINLLSNAVKFTEDGGRIECRTEVRDSEAVLVVSDTGIGIPVEEQSELFERFYRSSTAQDRAIQGTGLGLSIVAATVAAHGGRIDVRSAHLEGTTITVRLPRARVSATPGSPR
ncbi:ATP-binding protein [Nocardioides mangrovi]|uniref:Sensor-like histidine kinase SenX3 n=1 Tax=Nocardioides mangrovi TaxID=2874580 RepID=A0ABS7UKA6_9ACTN|nr:ATP-binding protein [Nocardioides mangrovi]MBZ5741027.1 PAS domain S-box protein [Nocardioides mangrovi]